MAQETTKKTTKKAENKKVTTKKANAKKEQNSNESEDDKPYKRVSFDLDKKILGFHQKLAKKDKRSFANYVDKLLTDIANGDLVVVPTSTYKYPFNFPFHNVQAQQDIKEPVQPLAEEVEEKQAKEEQTVSTPSFNLSEKPVIKSLGGIGALGAKKVSKNEIISE